MKDLASRFDSQEKKGEKGRCDSHPFGQGGGHVVRFSDDGEVGTLHLLALEGLRLFP